MRCEYDPEADAAYIYLKDMIPKGGVKRTLPVGDKFKTDGMINLDLDDKGRLVGIELIPASKLLPPNLRPKKGKTR